MRFIKNFIFIQIICYYFMCFYSCIKDIQRDGFWDMGFDLPSITYLLVGNSFVIIYLQLKK